MTARPATDFYGARNVAACEARGIELLIAVKRDEYNPAPHERFTEPAALPADATPTQAMAHKLKTKAGRVLYALRKQTVEPVFGIIKSVLGFRQISLRGLKKVTGEWTLVCLEWNLKAWPYCVRSSKNKGDSYVFRQKSVNFSLQSSNYLIRSDQVRLAASGCGLSDIRLKMQ